MFGIERGECPILLFRSNTSREIKLAEWGEAFWPTTDAGRAAMAIETRRLKDQEAREKTTGWRLKTWCITHSLRRWCLCLTIRSGSLKVGRSPGRQGFPRLYKPQRSRPQRTKQKRRRLQKIKLEQRGPKERNPQREGLRYRVSMTALTEDVPAKTIPAEAIPEETVSEHGPATTERSPPEETATKLHAPEQSASNTKPPAKRFSIRLPRRTK